MQTPTITSNSYPIIVFITVYNTRIMDRTTAT